MRSDLPVELLACARTWRESLDAYASTFPASSQRRRDAVDMVDAFDRVMTEFSRPFDSSCLWKVAGLVQLWLTPWGSTKSDRWRELSGFAYPLDANEAIQQLHMIISESAPPEQLQRPEKTTTTAEIGVPYKIVGSMYVPKGICIVTSKSGVIEHVGPASEIFALPQSRWSEGANFSFNASDYLVVRARMNAAKPDAPTLVS